MKETGDIVGACEVFWGEWLDFQDCNLKTEVTPETIMMEEDSFRNLPKESRILADIIINLPEEMFLVNGKLKKTFFRKLVKAKTGWNTHKMNMIQSKLESQLILSISQKF